MDSLTRDPTPPISELKTHAGRPGQFLVRGLPKATAAFLLPAFPLSVIRKVLHEPDQPNPTHKKRTKAYS